MDVGAAGAGTTGAGAGTTGGAGAGGTMNYQQLLDSQLSRQNDALAYKTASTEMADQFKLVSADLKNQDAISSSVSALANAQSQALSRA